MAYGNGFTYNGISLASLDPDLMVISFDRSSASNESILVSRKVDRSAITYDDSLTYDYGSSDTDIYSFSLTVARKDAGELSQSTVRNLISWLMKPRSPKWLTLDKGNCYTSAMYQNVEFKGRFTRVSYTESPGLKKLAITFVFENIAPYGFTPQYAWEFTLTNSSNSATITAPGTEVGKLIAPVVLITSNSNSGGASVSGNDNLEFVNGTGQVMSIYNYDANTDPFLIRVPSSTTVAVIGDNCYYYNNDTSFDTTGMAMYSFANLGNFNWPRMVSGRNRIQFVGTGSVTIVARFYEALGV